MFETNNDGGGDGDYEVMLTMLAIVFRNNGEKRVDLSDDFSR